VQFSAVAAEREKLRAVSKVAPVKGINEAVHVYDKAVDAPMAHSCGLRGRSMQKACIRVLDSNWSVVLHLTVFHMMQALKILAVVRLATQGTDNSAQCKGGHTYKYAYIYIHIHISMCTYICIHDVLFSREDRHIKKFLV